MPQREPALVTPFWVRIATETSVSPGWLLIAFPAVLYPTYLALEALFGRGLAAAMDFGGDYEARILPFWATLLGYSSMMGVYVARGALRDLDARHRGNPFDGSRCSPALAVPGELVVNCG